ncbi:hypothetical protein BIY37_10435 [Candidatus Brocadia sapporoensis]|uniref:Uncharacterized protein n=1 Tax=Candidatus Brocadia sapporoensis TaxID=392547 RepID=A0A1V6LY27_9BACT|nr:hypothetical protein BIY37_10435 [Candidatus Brocadia sapporoensis]
MPGSKSIVNSTSYLFSIIFMLTHKMSLVKGNETPGRKRKKLHFHLLYYIMLFDIVKNLHPA